MQPDERPVKASRADDDHAAGSYERAGDSAHPVQRDQLRSRCVEVFGDASEDPVEVYFDNYREKDKRAMPSRIRLQYGIEPMLLIDVESISFTAEEAKP